MAYSWPREVGLLDRHPIYITLTSPLLRCRFHPTLLLYILNWNSHTNVAPLLILTKSPTESILSILVSDLYRLSSNRPGSSKKHYISLVLSRSSKAHFSIQFSQFSHLLPNNSASNTAIPKKCHRPLQKDLPQCSEVYRQSYEALKSNEVIFKKQYAKST